MTSTIDLPIHFNMYNFVICIKIYIGTLIFSIKKTAKIQSRNFFKVISKFHTRKIFVFFGTLLILFILSINALTRVSKLV